MIHAYDEDGTSLAELKAERDALRSDMIALARRAADWRSAYAALALGTVDAPALHRLLARLLEENDKLKEEAQ